MFGIGMAKTPTPLDVAVVGTSEQVEGYAPAGQRGQERACDTAPELVAVAVERMEEVAAEQSCDQAAHR